MAPSRPWRGRPEAGDLAERLTVLHVAPHPDDEVLGAGATLLSLRDAGHRIVSFYCGFGRPEQRERRHGEALEACARARFEFAAPSAPADISSGNGAREAGQLVREIGAVLERERPAIVVSPSVRDRHPGHEVVARALRDVLEGEAGAQVRAWWMWGLWAELAHPTLATGFDRARLDEVVNVLEAYAGELERNDYRRLARGRAEMYASVGPERIFGFGTEANSYPYVEVLTEAMFDAGEWRAGAPRWLDPERPLAPPGDERIGEWLHAEAGAWS
jgi:LmbE family N-acetylglucosaminyl deacetylase